MDALEFVKTINRLCKNRHCNGCPVAKEGRCRAGFDDKSVESIEETISKVEQLAKDNSIKTRQREFLRMFPDAVIEDDGILCVDPCIIEKSIRCTNGKTCDDCRREYWLTLITEVTDNGNVY